jgi:hypothetical protein
MEETIICAAIWYKELPTQTFLPKNIKNGIIVCGHRHGHCIDIVKMLSGLRTVQIAPDGVGETIQGFLTNTNRFVDRTEAYQIAKERNQLNDRHHSEGTLYSEDLY